MITTPSGCNSQVDAIQKRYGSAAFIIAVGAAIVLLLLSRPAAARGIVLGAIFGIINFVLMGRMLIRRLSGNRRKAALLAFGGIAARYSLLALPIIAALKWQKFNLTAVIVGIFMIQLVLLLDQCCPAAISHITLKFGGMQKHGKSG